jgi:hypothetical protein
MLEVRTGVRIREVAPSSSDGMGPQVTAERWPRGRCEYRFCGKRGRWMVHGEIRCGEHRDSI